MINSVLLVDDDRALRDALAQTLDLADFNVQSCGSFIEAKDHILHDYSGVILSDIRMPGRDGFFLLDHVLAIDPDLPVVLLTGEGDVPMAVRAIKAGAYAFLEKPCPTEQLIGTLKNALEARHLTLQSRAAQPSNERDDLVLRMIFGISKAADKLRAEIRTAARHKSPVLIQGAPGSGISKVAEVIHLASGEVDAPFEKHAAKEMGRADIIAAINRAEGGSLFIDGLTQMPLDTQMALIDHLENPQTRLIIGTQNIGLRDISDGAVDGDLYYSLRGNLVRIPALADRPEDIPVLFRRYVEQACEQSGAAVPQISPQILTDLMARKWPGNARELMGEAMRFVMDNGSLRGASSVGLAEQMMQIERSLIEAALKEAKGNASQAAKALQLPRKTFYDKLARLNLQPEDYRAH